MAHNSQTGREAIKPYNSNIMPHIFFAEDYVANAEPGEDDGFQSAQEQESNGNLDDEKAQDFDNASDGDVDDHRGVGHRDDGSPMDPSDSRYNAGMVPGSVLLAGADNAPARVRDLLFSPLSRDTITARSFSSCLLGHHHHNNQSANLGLSHHLRQTHTHSIDSEPDHHQVGD